MVDLRRILENLPVGVWVARVPSGEVAYANPKFRSILGMDAVPESKIVDASLTYGIFDRDGHAYPVEKLPFSLVVSTGRAAVVDDLVLHRPDGRKINVRAFAYPDFDDNGTLAHVIVAFVDISKQVQAEAEREQMEARLALAVNHAPIAIWSMDVDGVVTLSQGAGLAAMGVASGQLVGQNLFELYREHPTIGDYLRRGLRGESFWCTVQIDNVIYDTWITPLRNAGGDIAGLAGLAHDVSEIRMLQSSAIQNDRAIALGTLAASVAHEINNPLTYMLGQLQFMREMLDDLDGIVRTVPRQTRAGAQELLQQMHKTLEPIRTGTQRIAAITRELRTFSRPADEPPGPVDVRSVVESVLTLMRKELEARARLEVTLGQTPPVMANPSRLVQVVMNLVVNAKQALSEDSTGTNAIWIRAVNEGPLVVIEVEDNGPGVPADDRERIFEPFVTTKRVGEGTGLGLFVCRNILRDISGTISALDRTGGGAVFRVELPAARFTAANEQSVEAMERPVDAPASLGHVLIIDDDLLVAQALSRHLMAGGYRVTVEQDPRRAVEILAGRQADFDLVYCDLMMKKMSGMDFADLVAVRAPSRAAKVVFMTGGAFTPRARDFLDRYSERCVEKPFDILNETSRRLGRLL